MASVWFSLWICTPSLASMAWCMPSLYRRPASKPAGVLVDDEHLAVDDDVVLVALEQLLGLDRVVEEPDERGVHALVQVVDAEVVLDRSMPDSRTPTVRFFSSTS